MTSSPTPSLLSATDAGRVPTAPGSQASPSAAVPAFSPVGADPSRSVADVLDAAADLLSKPGAWTQGAMARVKQYGQEIAWDHPDATCWCAAGALARVDKAISLQAAITLCESTSGLIGFNDARGRTQDEVVAKLREAAQASRQEQQKEGGK